jgi:enediyne biosynthesis protein E8
VISAPADDEMSMTLEAYADTILPGEKRSPTDHAVAGADTGGGAAAGGALAVLRSPEGGMEPVLEMLAEQLNEHARQFAAERGITPDPDLPPFVALSYPERVALVQELTDVGHAERELWVSLAMFSTIAFDSASHLPTAEAIATGHPGLATLGYFPPDTDGLWRFPDYSYGRQLARPHPDTTPSGSPA